MNAAMPDVRRMTDERRQRLAQGIADAAALIDARGWCRGGMEDRQSRVCMMGAVRDTFLGQSTKDRHKAYDIINRALGADMTQWNDAQPAQEAVTARLRQIAAQVGPHIVRAMCPHRVPVCTDCGRAVGCYSQMGRPCAGRWHGPDCPSGGRA